MGKIKDNSRIILISIIILMILIIFGLYNLYFKYESTFVSSGTKNMGNDKILSLMYEKNAGSGEYVASDETTWPSDGYVFNTTLSKCENGSNLTYDEANNKVEVLSTKSDKCYVYFDKAQYHEYCNDSTLACTIAKKYTSDGTNGLYLHDGSGDYTNADLEAGDWSYRYSGAEVNNYVCFGSDADPCPTDNLYRIIGVFGDNVKLMKAEYATDDMLGGSGVGDYAMQYSETTYATSYYTKGSVALEDIAVYYWNYTNETSSVNNWHTSRLNLTNLNENYVNYLNSIDTKWMGYIADTTWYVAGLSVYHNHGVDQETGLDNNAKTTYDWEVGDNATKEGQYTATDGSTAYAQYTDGKIGLIYASDYMYAASPEYWNLPGYTDADWQNQDGVGGSNYDYRKMAKEGGSWMYMGLHEWTISRSATYMERAFIVGDDGHVGSRYMYLFTNAVRPSFNLESSVIYAQGDGSSSNPFRIQ